MAQCSSNFHPELLQIHMYICYCVCCYSAENYPFPSAFCHFICLRLVCCVCFSPFFIFIFLLHLVLDFLIRGLYFLCRFGACNEMCGHFKWRNEPKRNTNLDCLSIKEKKRSQHEQERNAKMEHLCWISVCRIHPATSFIRGKHDFFILSYTANLCTPNDVQYIFLCSEGSQH